MSDAYEGWAIVEQMGYVEMIGKVREVAQYGTTMMRIDVLQPDGSFRTQDIGGSSLYRLTPTTEETARELVRPVDVRAWELPRLTTPAASDEDVGPPSVPLCQQTTDDIPW